MWRHRLKAWWRREVFIPVPTGFDYPTEAKPGADPRFLREMAESMRKCPIVYENMNVMYRRRMEAQRRPLPTMSAQERQSAEWERERAAIEASLLHELLSGPFTCAKALNDLANRKTEMAAGLNENWSLEGAEE